jgi:hypothetical protein
LNWGIGRLRILWKTDMHRRGLLPGRQASVGTKEYAEGFGGGWNTFPSAVVGAGSLGRWRGGKVLGSEALQGLLGNLEFLEQACGLALDDGEAEVAFEFILDPVKGGGHRSGAGEGVSKTILVAEFDPGEMDEAHSDGTFEFALGLDDQLPVGGGEDFDDDLAEVLGEPLPTGVVTYPMGEIRTGDRIGLAGLRGLTCRVRSGIGLGGGVGG